MASAFVNFPVPVGFVAIALGFFAFFVFFILRPGAKADQKRRLRSEEMSPDRVKGLKEDFQAIGVRSERIFIDPEAELLAERSAGERGVFVSPKLLEGNPPEQVRIHILRHIVDPREKWITGYRFIIVLTVVVAVWQFLVAPRFFSREVIRNLSFPINVGLVIMVMWGHAHRPKRGDALALKRTRNPMGVIESWIADGSAELEYYHPVTFHRFRPAKPGTTTIDVRIDALRRAAARLGIPFEGSNADLRRMILSKLPRDDEE